MVNKPRNVGTKAETAVTRYLLENGVPAHRTAQHGSADVGDIHALNGLVVLEVKSHKGHPSPGQVDRWMTETDAEAARVPSCDVAALVVKRPGSAKPADWTAHMRVIDLLVLLGLGDAVDAVGVRHNADWELLPVHMPLHAYVALVRGWAGLE
jgi:hypothetical protein